MGLSSLTASDALASLLLVVAAGATAWYVGRLLVALVLVLVARRRPRYRRWALHCAPAALRPLLARALLGGLLTAGLTGTASWADPAASCPPDAGAVPLLDRADLCAAAQPDSPAGAAATDPPASQPTEQDGQRAQATYSVRSGDSLWTIAEGLLGGDPDAKLRSCAERRICFECEYGLRRITCEDLTVSLRAPQPGLVIVDEAEIPDQFWKPQPPRLDRQGLIDYLKDGGESTGACLGNGTPSITVRTR